MAKPKSHSFSIYLLRAGETPESSLRDDTKLEEASSPSSTPEESRLYILDSPPREPWWKGYFGVTENLWQSFKGALLYVPVGDRWFALTFGQVHHNLKDESYEYDFGLRVTLNSLDPLRLRSTDTIQPGPSQRRRTQLPRESDLTFFDFDRDSTILKSLTGKVRDELKPLFKQATGSSSLRISSDTLPSALSDLLEKLLEIYASNDYKTSFPDIQNITPVREPWVKDKLDAKLEAALRGKDPAVTLAVPEIINYSDDLYVTFGGKGQGLLYDDVYLDRLYEYLDSKGADPSSMDLADFKGLALILTKENEVPTGRFALYRTLIFETQLDEDDADYHLVEGQWYRVQSDYILRVANTIDPHFATNALPDFDDADEAAYNIRVADESGTAVCLDKENISPLGQKQVEPCDVLRLEGGTLEMLHVKRSTLSNQLSHLFNQGANSYELIRLEPAALQRLKDLIEAKFAGDPVPLLAAVDGMNVDVWFVIVTHKDTAKKSDNLPLFSRISLMRNLRALKAMGIDAKVSFVRDATMAKAGKKKARKKKAAI